MAITVSVANGPSFTFEGDDATIGSDPSCTISLPQDPRIKLQHAVLRRIAGRWMIESKDGEIRVGSDPPAKVKWLSPGDAIELTPLGPQLLFQPASVATTAKPVLSSAPQAVGNKRTAAIGALVGSVFLLVVYSLFLSRPERDADARTEPAAEAHSVESPENGSSVVANPAAAKAPASSALPAEALDKFLTEIGAALYVVVIKSPDHDEMYRLGNAWAVSPTALVTSAAIGMAIEDSKSTFPVIKVQTLDTKREFEATAIKVHPAYGPADSAAKAAVTELEGMQAEIENAPDKMQVEQLTQRRLNAEERLFHAFETQVAFDLAVIEVKGPLPKSLEIAHRAEPKAGTGVWLAGFPFGNDEFLVDREQPGRARGLKGSVFLRQPLPQSPEPAARLLVKFAIDLTGQNCAGCPIVNAAGKVVAVYSRPTPPIPSDDGDMPPPTHDVSDISHLKALLTSP